MKEYILASVRNSLASASVYVSNIKSFFDLGKQGQGQIWVTLTLFSRSQKYLIFDTDADDKEIRTEANMYPLTFIGGGIGHNIAVKIVI